jgi:hypothetical protein
VRSPATVVVGITLAGGLAAALAVGAAGFDESKRAARFDRTTWLKPVEWCTSSVRGRMVDDLVARHLTMRMPMSSVRTLLGAPDEVTKDGVWFYSVSAERKFFLPTCVGLELDVTRGRLVRALVTRDD